MKIDTETYRGIEIEVYYNEPTKYFYALSKVGNSSNEFDTELGNRCMGFVTPAEAVNDVKGKIDRFMEEVPRTYKELAEAITSSLVWTGYEECYADEDVIKHLVSAFIKTIPKQ